VNPKNLILFLNLRLRLNDSISLITFLIGKLLVHVSVVFARVLVQVIKVILQPERILLIVPHECLVEMELWHLGLSICQDDLMQCDRTTSEIRGLSPKIISGDSQ
jgi:hypothetical protein